MTSTQKEPGLNCPQCGQFIRTTIQELLTAQRLKCPHCHLTLTINRNESKRAMEILKDVNEAQQNLNKASNFSR